MNSQNQNDHEEAPQRSRYEVFQKQNTEVNNQKAKLTSSPGEQDPILDINAQYERSCSPTTQNEPQSNRFQMAFQKLKTMKSNKKFSQEYDQQLFTPAAISSVGESPENTFSRRAGRQQQENQEGANLEGPNDDFRPPYLQQRYGKINAQQTHPKEQEEGERSGFETGNNQSFGSDFDRESDQEQPMANNFKRRVSRALEKHRESRRESMSRRGTLNLGSNNLLPPSTKNATQKNVGFDDEELSQALLQENNMNEIQLVRNASKINPQGILVQDLNQRSPVNPLMLTNQSGRSSIVKRDAAKRGNSASLKEESKLRGSQGRKLLDDLNLGQDIDDGERAPAILRYGQAISLQYHGDMNVVFPIHSQSPYSDQVEISHRPSPQKMSASIDFSSKKFNSSLRDYQCSPALRQDGDIFRILPSSEFQNLNKIKKILKNKVELDAQDHYKYGEHLESLSEEFKYNLGVFEEFKNEIVKFGSYVIFMHEKSQKFLKISSPNLSDLHQNFKLELTSIMSEKCIFKLIPSSKIQQEGEGRISETDQFFIGYTYDRILNKDLYLYQDPTLLERQVNKSPKGIGKFNQQLLRLVFSEEKKLPFHFNISPKNNFEMSQNIFKHLHGKIIQIKHIESDLYLTLTIKRKENRVLNLFFSDKNRYQLNKLVDDLPDIYGSEASCNVHFEPRSSINTYWKIICSPFHKDKIMLENAVSKIRLKPLHLEMRNKGSGLQQSIMELSDQDGIFFKLFSVEQISQNDVKSQLRASILEQVNSAGYLEQQKFIWVEYLKYNKQDNKYEFSKFGSLNDEDKGNLFDSFKIHEVDVYKARAFEFLSYSFRSFRSFDFYQADNEECQEYERILGVIKKLKKFVKNKLEGCIMIDEPCGEPYKDAQIMLKEAFIIDEIAELIDNIWPDENYMKQDFTGKAFSSKEDGHLSDIKSSSSKTSSLTSESNISQADEDPHRDVKMLIAEKIFELLRLIVDGNLLLQEYVFFEIVPNIQKFFGAGFRDNQDFELFNYLVKNCDTYADYKEKTKYNIIFQFIRKLKKENSFEIELNLFSILRSFCINSKGEANNYHQKLLHDMFFNNEVEGIKFKIQEKKTSRYKSTIKGTSVIDENPDSKSVKKIQKDLKEIEQQRDSFLKSRSMKDQIAKQDAKNLLSQERPAGTARAEHLDIIQESRRDYSYKEEVEENKNILEIPTLRQNINEASTPQKLGGKPLDKNQDIFLEEESESQRDRDNRVNYETVDGSQNDFLIKQIHAISLDKITENLILSNSRDTELLRVELYFFADLCFHMNFGCKCSHFSNSTVQNILRLLSNPNSIMDSHLKAGLARILNTILRNNDDNILQRPYFLKIYEKQEFQKPQLQQILSSSEIRTLVKLTRQNFRQLSVEGMHTFSEYDSEIMRLTQYLIQSNLIFEKDFTEGYNYVLDIFEDVSRLHIKISSTGEVTTSNLARSQTLELSGKRETSLNLEDFERQYMKIRKLLESQITNGHQGLNLNPFAWKMQNIEKLYTSYVERLVNSEKQKKLLSIDSEKDKEKMEGARLETIKFFQWLINLRVDSLLSNIVNMFFSQLESYLEREDSNLDQLLKNPEKYFTFSYMQRLMTDMLKGGEASKIGSSDGQFSFLNDIFRGESASRDQGKKGEIILDLEEMYQEFLKKQLKMDNIEKTRAGFSSPIKHHFHTEGDEISEENGQINKGALFEERNTPRKQIQFMTSIEEEIDKMDKEELQMKETLTDQKALIDASQAKSPLVSNNILQKSFTFLKTTILNLYQRYKNQNCKEGEENNEEYEKQRSKRQFLDILIDIFVNTSSSLIQQETLRAIYKYLNLRRELLLDLSQTILIFKQSDKGKIIKMNQALKSIKMICQDSTTWEIPPQNERKTLGDDLSNALDDLEEDIIDQPVLRSTTKANMNNKQIKDKKYEYAQKIKEHQKNQSSLIQQLSFTKSNKSTIDKIKQIELLIENLDIVNEFFLQNQVSKYSFKGIQNSSYLIQIEKYEAFLRALPADELDFQITFIQPELQYSFLAIQGHQFLLNFIKEQKDLRQECMRIIFFGTKPSQGRIFTEADSQNQRIQFAVKLLVAYKKCYEILAKFVYNNKTTKKVLLNDLEEILLFNSEYYMQSKMAYQFTLYEFELLNYVLQDNTRIQQISSTLSTKVMNLVQFITKIIEFPKKPFSLSPMILKVYSSIISICDNPKINDCIVDIILREEVFFQIQSLLLGINMKKSKLSPCEQLSLIEKFLGGISQILSNSNVRMIKKKFYQIFSKINNQETYFNHLRELLVKSCDHIKLSLSNNQQDNSNKSGKFNPLLAKSQSKSILNKIEDEIKIFGQKFMRVEGYLIVIFNKLFFDVKGTAKQIQDKVEELRSFIQARERDITILDNYNLDNYYEWPEYEAFDIALLECQEYCTKNLPKFLALTASQKKTFQRTQTLLSQYNLSSRRSSTKDFQLRGLSVTNTQKDDQSNEGLKSFESASSDIANKLKTSFQMRMNSLVSSMKQNQLATKKEQIFKVFKWNTLHDDNMRSELKKEQRSFAEIMLRKFKLADENSNELANQRYYIFFSKLVQYSNLFLEDKDKLGDTKILVEIFSQFIDLTNEAQSYKGEGFEAKTLIQEKLHQIGAVQMALDMMCSDNNEQIDELFPQLLYFSNRILDGAANNIQDFFTEYLTKNEKAINLFERCFNLIDKEIQLLRKNAPSQSQTSEEKILTQNKLKPQKVPKVYDKKINVTKQILKFFKNLCENHNTKMQLLVGNQQHPDKNFDMVSLTVNYLHALISNINLSKQNYSNAQNCCISLAEYIQGPCFVNQNRIKDANFYQLAIQILSLKPTLSDENNSEQQNKAENEKECEKLFLGLQKRKSINSKVQFQSKFDISELDKIVNTVKQENSFSVSNFMIQKLKLNCTIILISLLEQRQSDDPLLLSMKRSIPIDIIKQNIVYEYFLFCKDYKKFLSRENFFRHVLTQSDYEIQEELIIEVGFNLYFLLKRWSEHKKTNDNQLDDLMNFIEQEQEQNGSFFGIFYEMVQLYKSLKKDVRKLFQKYVLKKQNKDKLIHLRSKLKKFVDEEQNLKEALLFFKKNSASIDVLVKNDIEQVQFPYMPYCTYLSEEEKVEFYNALPTDRDKEKIEVLVDTSTDLIRRMKIEYQFKKFFFGYPIIGELVYHTELWKTFAFYTILSLNIMNLYSFSAANDHDRLFNPVFWNFSETQTQYLYFCFGLIQIALSILINFTIISKRAIYHYQLVFDERNSDSQSESGESTSQKDSGFKSYFKKAKKEIMQDLKDYSLSAIQDFQLLYYLGYLLFSFIGFIYHPFFYAYHMIDMIIRNPYLKNVLKAIYRPRYELFNTVILFLCLQYIFSMLSYVFFFEDFEKGECTSLSQCFLVIIDQTFKNDGGIGTFLQRAYPEEMNKGGGISMLRFAFDNTFNVLLVILVVEIISGIIIDTFGALREEHNKITESIENKCMICGRNRDQIEKEYQDMLANEESAGNSSSSKQNEERAFDMHKKYKHNIYDYIFFLAYLQEKPELEYTGLESFVSEKYDEKNNTWFPIYKVGGDKGQAIIANEKDEDDSDASSGESDEEGEDQQSGFQNAKIQDSHASHATKSSEGSQAQTNKLIIDCLLQINTKIEQMSEQISQNQIQNSSRVEDENNLFLNNAGLSYRQTNAQSRRETSSARQPTNKVKAQHQNSNLLVAQSNLMPGSISRVSASNNVSRQNSNRFQKAKNKINAVNAFLR